MAQPRLSVVLPWSEPRGHGAQHLQKWLTGQTLPREEYQVVVGCGSGRAGDLAWLRTQLAPQDLLVPAREDNDLYLWDAAARAAQAEWLFLTELHCLPKKDTLERVLEEAGRGRFDEFCVESLHINKTDIAWLEERIYRDLEPIFKAPGHWNKVRLRGFAIHRDWYLKAGGLPGAYDLFAELVLAMNLHRQGARLGHVGDPVVYHINQSTLPGHYEDICRFVENEARYRLKTEESEWQPYIGLPDAFRKRWLGEAGALRAARATCRLAGAEGKTRLPGGHWESKEKQLRHPHGWAERCRLRGSHLYWGWRCRAAQGRTEERYALYQKQTEALIRLCYARTLSREPAAPFWQGGPLEESKLLEPSFSSGGGWGNFHSVETWQGRRFRWSESLAGWVLRLKPGCWKLRLDAGGLAGTERLAEALFTWNGGNILPRFLADGKAEFQVCQEGNRPGIFCLAVKPLDLAATGETRELGLPVFALELVREPGPTASSSS
jgi:hypothetical protein